MPKNLRFDNANSRSVPYDDLDPAALRQLRRLAVERRPAACCGCGYEHHCTTHGCAVIRKALEALDTSPK